MPKIFFQTKEKYSYLTPIDARIFPFFFTVFMRIDLNQKEDDPFMKPLTTKQAENSFMLGKLRSAKKKTKTKTTKESKEQGKYGQT